MYENQIAQVIDAIPHLTPEQVAACNEALLPIEAHGAASAIVGDQIDAIMAQVLDADGGVFAVARACILGLIAEPQLAVGQCF